MRPSRAQLACAVLVCGDAGGAQWRGGSELGTLRYERVGGAEGGHHSGFDRCEGEREEWEVDER